jgi:hypothetical protein
VQLRFGIAILWHTKCNNAPQTTAMFQEVVHISKRMPCMTSLCAQKPDASSGIRMHKRFGMA